MMNPNDVTIRGAVGGYIAEVDGDPLLPCVFTTFEDLVAYLRRHFEEPKEG